MKTSLPRISLHGNGPAPDLSVAILILNWNGWRDTVECLESVFRSSDVSFRVVVSDNGSGDGSLDHIKHWADGEVGDPGRTGGPHSSAPCTKPIAWAEYDRVEAERGGDAEECAPLVLIQTGANLGFAGGNNVGLRYCLAHGGFDYVWVLNNDTVVEPDALRHLVDRMESDSSLGMCGSRLVFYHQPTMIQAYGGSGFDLRRGIPLPIGLFQPVTAQCDTAEVERQMVYVVGASMLVSRHFLESVGLMGEDYFLYYEEIDWAFRAREKFSLGYCDKSVVFHKEGGSIGSSSTREPSAVSTRYLYRNRVVFNRRFNRANLARCLMQIAFELLVLVKRRHFRTARVALGASLMTLLGVGHER